MLSKFEFGFFFSYFVDVFLSVFYFIFFSLYKATRKTCGAAQNSSTTGYYGETFQLNTHSVAGWKNAAVDLCLMAILRLALFGLLAAGL